MNFIGQKWRRLPEPHTLFYGYRWLTWVFAGLAITLPIVPPDYTQRYAWLLVLTGVLNTLATFLSRPYVRIAQRRPFLLAFDILLSITLVWLSGGYTLPFLPYAFGSLLLPAMVLNWRGALIAGLSFSSLDWVSLLASGADVANSTSLTVIIVRSLAPLAFVFLVGSVPRFTRRAIVATPPSPTSAQELAVSSESERLSREVNNNAFQRFADRGAKAERSREQMSADTPLAAQLTAIRAAEEQGSQELRRAIGALTPGLDVELSVALNQLAGGFQRQCGVDARLSLVGPLQPLSLAQHITLLKLAQEALINIQQHARAHTALVTLRYEPRAITLTVQDDGVGLLDGTHERPGVHALRAMRYRLAELDGHLEVFEGESGGVTVRGTLPLDDH